MNETSDLELASLRRFKAYIHQRLDEAGIPTHPDGKHSREGCRVGDRLDILCGLTTAIRKHRDQRGDDRCWMDDEEVYKALPEGFMPPARDTTVELANCQRFIACRHNPATQYISPQRRIEELEHDVAARATHESAPEVVKTEGK